MESNEFIQRVAALRDDLRDAVSNIDHDKWANIRALSAIGEAILLLAEVEHDRLYEAKSQFRQGRNR